MRAIIAVLLLLIVAGCGEKPTQNANNSPAEVKANQELKAELESVRQQAERAEKEAKEIKEKYEADKLAEEIKAKEFAEEQRMAREIQQTLQEAAEKLRKEAAFQALVDRFNSLNAMQRRELNSFAKRIKDGEQLNTREQQRMDQLGWGMPTDFIIEHFRAGVAAARAVSEQKEAVENQLKSLPEDDREELKAMIARMNFGEKLDRKYLNRLAEIGGEPFREYVENELKLLDEMEKEN